MKAIGIINIILGGMYIIMNLISLLIIYIEKVIFTKLHYGLNEFIPFNLEAYMNDLFDVMLVTVPLSLIAYILFLMGGVKILKKNHVGIKLTKTSSWIIIASYFFYMAYMYIVLSPYIEQLMINKTFMLVILIIILIFGFVFTCGYPIFLLIYFNKPRQFK